MNKLNTGRSPDFRDALTEPVAQAPAQGPTAAGLDAAPLASTSAPAKLGEADAQLLHKVLVGGEAPLARQSDLIELHRRIVQLFATLGTGLREAQADKAAADRAALEARIEAMEGAVDRMEGALRIEFEPVLRRALGEVMATRPPAPRHRLRLVTVLLVGTGLGVFFNSAAGTALIDNLSPYGGSLAARFGLP